MKPTPVTLKQTEQYLVQTMRIKWPRMFIQMNTVQYQIIEKITAQVL